MTHGVGPLFLTGSLPTYSGLTSTEPVPNRNIGVGFGEGSPTIRVGSTELGSLSVPEMPSLSRIYWNPIDSEWAATTQMTVAVFTTPSASVGGRSLNPLSQVDEEQFVTAEGGDYLEQSGIREAAGLGGNLSWTVPPAEVASRSVTFLGNQATLRSYVGYVKTADSEVPRSLLVNLATTETDDDIAFGVTVQHRAMYTIGDSRSVAPTDSILSAMSVPDLVGTELSNGLNVTAGDDITLILEDGIAASADLAETALGDLSLA